MRNHEVHRDTGKVPTKIFCQGAKQQGLPLNVGKINSDDQAQNQNDGTDCKTKTRDAFNCESREIHEKKLIKLLFFNFRVFDDEGQVTSYIKSSLCWAHVRRGKNSISYSTSGVVLRETILWRFSVPVHFISTCTCSTIEIIQKNDEIH